jgi:hypothetical protein
VNQVVNSTTTGDPNNDNGLTTPGLGGSQRRELSTIATCR